LLEDIKANAVEQSYASGNIIMRTGQYIRNTILVLSGSIKVYREGEDGGEFFYLLPSAWTSLRDFHDLCYQK